MHTCKQFHKTFIR